MPREEASIHSVGPRQEQTALFWLALSHEVYLNFGAPYGIP